jgi:hypothetical protein
MVVRMFTDSDYEMVCGWWKSWGWPSIPLSTLSKTGIIVENEVPVCAAWVYQTDSDTCLIEWFISNKSATKAQRAGCLEVLIDACKDIAKTMGYAKAFCSVRNQNLIKKLEAAGIHAGEDNMVNMVGVL